MPDFLKGNFRPAKPVTGPDTSAEEEDLETRFEREAVKRLGGSMAFVAKKKVTWSLDDNES